MLDFNHNLYLEEFNFKDTAELRETPSLNRGDVPTSEQISGIEVRLSKAHIIDNKTKPFGPFPGLAKVYFMNIIISDISASQLALNLDGFEKVDDNQQLSVDRTLFYWKKVKKADKAPSQIHVMSSLIKSKQALRNTADILAKAKDNSDYKNLAGKLGTLLKNTASVTNVSSMVFEMAGIIGKLLGKVDDKPLLTRFQSFTDVAGNFNQLGKTDHPFKNRYAEVDFSIYIRDKTRQEESDT